MPQYKVTATMDVGYAAIIEAENVDAAWQIVEDNGFESLDNFTHELRGDNFDWQKTDNGHDWTLESIQEGIWKDTRS